jgi:putative hydrolase of the HAD superfamily
VAVTIQLIGFDGDDTLWYHGREFVAAQKRILTIVRRYASEADWDREFSRIEADNLKFFGYGVSSFVLSVVEAAAYVTRGRISSYELADIVNIGKQIVDHDIEVVEGTMEVLSRLKENYKLLLITKGEKAEQIRKVEKSKIVHLFGGVEVVHEKDELIYRSILRKYDLDPAQFVMVGNSIRSDILPVVNIGAWAIHVPHEIVWHHERAQPPTSSPYFFSVPTIDMIPELLRRIENALTQ